MQGLVRLGCICLVLILKMSVANAIDLNSPIGVWQTIDDKTGNPKAIIKVEAVGDIIQGTVIHTIAQKDEQPITHCKKCPGEFHNKPINGLRVMWNLHQVAKTKWDGGKILDPKTGEIYRCSLRLSPDGSVLNVRGYIGISLLGRSQSWHRLAQSSSATEA